MTINNIKTNNFISKSVIEDNRDLLSNDEKEKLLSVFDSIDKNEEDNENGVITTEIGLNIFLKEIKNIISDKYNKFLDSVGLPHLKNDKNFNNILDKEDFSSEQWEKITGFAPFLGNGAKWTKDIYMLINKIFDKSESKNNSLDEVIVETTWGKYTILYDDKTRTIKSAMFNDNNGYCDSYFECKLDENSDVIKEIEVTVDGHYTTPQGEYVKISYPLFNDFVVSMGFTQLKEQKYTQREIEERVKLWKESGAYSEEDNTTIED